MTAAAVVTLITEILINLPVAVKTGREVIHVVNLAYEQLQAAIAGREDVTPEEIAELVKKIVANSATIQSL